MQISKERFTTTALSFVEPNKAYDHEEVILKTAIELADNFYEEFWKAMSMKDVENMRIVFKGIARNTIDWHRVNRKAHPEDYADSIEYNAWPEILKGEYE